MSASDYIFLLWQVCLLLSPLWGLLLKGWQKSLEKIKQSSISSFLSIFQFTRGSNVSVDCLEGLSTPFSRVTGSLLLLVLTLLMFQTCRPLWRTSRARVPSLCSPRRTWACVPWCAPSPSPTWRQPSPSTLTTPARDATGMLREIDRDETPFKAKALHLHIFFVANIKTANLIWN